MDREKIKKLIPLYIEGELNPDEEKQVREYLAQDLELQKYAQEMKDSWNILGEYKSIEPDPNYISRFWTNVSSQKVGVKHLFGILQKEFTFRKFAPAMVTMCLFVIVSTIVLQNYGILWTIPSEETLNLAQADIELLENLELAENLDILEDLDFLENFDIIESLETHES